MVTFSDRFDARRNSFDILRLVFASVVAVTHSLAIQTGHQPYLGKTPIGFIGLDGFFIVSGFLVTRSFLRLNSPVRFVWHRFLRIMPGFWACLLVVGFVVAPLAAALRGYPLTTPFTGDPSALRYVLGNSGLLIVQYDIAGILAGTPEGVSFNGALWTLFFEAACYALVLGAGVLGLLRRRRWTILVLAGVLTLLTVLREVGIDVGINELVLRLGYVFVLGMVAYLYADKIPARVDLLLVAVALTAVSALLFSDYRVVGAASLAYALTWLGTWQRAAWSMRHDLSYGVYIYHWPIFQLLGLTVVASAPAILFLGVGLAMTTVVAALSWFLIERRAMAHKNMDPPRWVRREPGRGRTTSSRGDGQRPQGRIGSPQQRGSRPRRHGGRRQPEPVSRRR